MAVSIIGYPQETNFCPKCGSSNIVSHDSWDDDGKMECGECGCKCYIVDAAED